MKIVGQQVQVFRPAILPNASAKPKSFLNAPQARQALAPAKVFDPRGQQNLAAEAAAVEKRQLQEKTLLATTQAQEIKTMQLKRDTETKQVSDAAARAKVTKDYQIKISDLQKNHVVETQQLTARHQNDVAQVKRITQAPPDKKKKIDQE